MPMVAAMNYYAAIDRVVHGFMESGGKVKPSERDLKLWDEASRATKELP